MYHSNVQKNGGIVVIGKRVFINGKELPPCPSKSKNCNVTTINEKVYINGYEFKRGKWRRTLMALYHFIF